MTWDGILDALNAGDLIQLGMQADAIRTSFHPHNVITYSNEPAAAPVATLRYDANRSGDFADDLRALREGHRAVFETVMIWPQNATAVEYLRALAVARVYLDGVPHFQVSPQRCGLKVCQLALRFGANDIAGWSEDQTGYGFAEEELRRIIRDAGLIPKQRDALFRACYLD